MQGNLERKAGRMFPTSADEEILPNVVWHRQSRPSIQQDFQNLVVVFVSGQDERCDIGGEGRRRPVHGFPAL